MENMNCLFSMIKDYLTHYLPTEKKSSRHTIRSYQIALEQLLDFVKIQNKIPLYKVTFEMIDRDTLLAFLDHLEIERHCSAATRNHRLHAIRAFYGYAAENNISAVAYWEEISKVDHAKTPEKMVQHMSAEAVSVIVNQPDTNTKKGLRDMFLMLFLYKTGARISELLDIKLCDIRLGKSPTVTLHGKGGKIRAVPLREDIVLHLKGYLKAFHPNEGLYSEQYLFYVVRQGLKKRMTDDNARDLIKKYGASAKRVCLEVPKNVHPHLFRHSCAMHLYQSGVHLTLVSQWLGHANLETTLIYAHADTEIKRKAIEAAIPKETPLAELINSDRFKVDDESMLKQLCGLR